MGKTKKKIMILGASILQVPAIAKAKEMGFEVLAVDMNPNAVGFQFADKKLVISTIDIDAVVKAAKEEEIDAVMTLASDMPMRTVAAVCKELNLVGIDEETALRATNKAEMRKCLKANGVPVPRFYKVSNEEEYIEKVKKFKTRFMVKPADNSGSRGVFLVDDAQNEELISYAYKYSRENSRSGDVVVEEYMQGAEVSVETLSVDGECHIIQITDKLTTGAPNFVEMGHSQPTQHTPEIVEQIKTVAKMAVKAIGIKNGPSHTEIIITKSGPKIVELGARLGGDCITTHLVPLSTGVDMVENCILIAFGEQPNILPKWERGAAIRYMPSQPGILKKVSHLEEASKIDDVEEIQMMKQVGDQLTAINSSTARLGFIITTGEKAQTAVDKCYQAMEKIEIVIE